ncbi:3-oxoacyl-ACP reductase FabG [Actinomycetospora corticicola]|uniref:NAD(P)-dependent dehydrogenase (Short-subunit alcohol dehydrogenase family) n=1 Tax=Actinomycetospora corticicola TaxID=663602 RepID=A0A7Y9DV96_9PSEU|nr:NAD(P)-dependent dehydrogenase (short-subunit alcohol dehydrogenase family) [Actinomycetospora corticicola]
MTGVVAGTRVVVTGASRGIGRAEALALAAEGARVVVGYGRSADAADAVVAEITDAGGEAHAVAADMADPAAVTALMDRAAELLGGIDVLVSNAGIEHFGALGTITAEEFDHVFAVNTRGQLLAVQAAAAHMGSGGRIVCTSSIAASTPVPGHALYAGSKAAVEAMVKVLALDLVPRGITINAIAPGGTTSDMSAENGKHYDNDLAPIAWPMGRYGEPEDITPLVRFLASPESGWMTGQTLRISGGQ